MNRRIRLWTLAAILSAIMFAPEATFAAVGGKNYNITGQNVIDGTPIADVYYFNANQTFNTDSNPGRNGQWSELNLLLFSIYVANIDFSAPSDPIPLAASTIGLSAGSQIAGITVARIGPLITLTSTYGGAQIP